MKTEDLAQSLTGCFRRDKVCENVGWDLCVPFRLSSVLAGNVYKNREYQVREWHDSSTLYLYGQLDLNRLCAKPRSFCERTQIFVPKFGCRKCARLIEE